MYPLISQPNLQNLVNVITDLVIILSKLRLYLFLFHFTLVNELITNYSKEKKLCLIHSKLLHVLGGTVSLSTTVGVVL